MQLPVVILALASLGAPESLTLEAAISIAEERADEMIRVREDVVLADVTYAEARAAILPSVSMSGSATEVFLHEPIVETRFVAAPENVVVESRDDLDLVYGPFRDQQLGRVSHPALALTLSARQLVFDGGRWWLVLSRVANQKRGVRETFRTIKNNLRLSVVQSFYNVAKAREGLRIARLQVEFSEAQLSGRRASGAKASDIAAAERNLASDRVGLTRQTLTLESRRRSLNTLIGRRPDVPFVIEVPLHVRTATDTSPQIDVPEVDPLVAKAQRRRPEIIRMAEDLEVRRKNAGIEAAAHWPQVFLNAAYTRASRRPDRIFSDPTTNFTASLGLSMSLNLYNGGRISARVQRWEIEYRKLLATYEQLKKDIHRVVLDRIQGLKVLLQVQALALTGARAAEETVRLVQSQYQAGDATALELRDAELGLVQAQRSVVNGRYDIEVALEQLRHAVGGPIDD